MAKLHYDSTAETVEAALSEPHDFVLTGKASVELLRRIKSLSTAPLVTWHQDLVESCPTCCEWFEAVTSVADICCLPQSYSGRRGPNCRVVTLMSGPMTSGDRGAGHRPRKMPLADCGPDTVFLGDVVPGEPRAELVKALHQVGLVVYGDTGKWKRAANISARKPVWDADVDAVNRSARVVVSQSRSLGTPQYTSVPLFNAAAVGACVAVEAFEGLKELYPARAVTTFDSVEQAVVEIKALLKDADRRRRMRHEAEQHTWRHHTWSDRIRVLLEEVARAAPAPVKKRERQKVGGGGVEMRVVLATIALNEEEMLERLIAQHLGWPGLVGWVFVEGAAEHFGEANPGRVSPEGLSVDRTSEILRRASEDSRITYVPFGWSGGEKVRMGQQKVALRNAYCEVADRLGAQLLVVLDADEMYTIDAQRQLMQLVQGHRGPKGDWRYDSWLLRQRHLWRPPSLAARPVTELEVSGGYWEVPHIRVWRYEKGARYRENHNTLGLPGAMVAPGRVYQFRSGDPECIHLGFARDDKHRRETNAYYIARGEGQERQGRNRQMYVECRAAWASWRQGARLPHGARVVRYRGPKPEVLRG